MINTDIIQAKFMELYARVTLTRVTLAFFLFSFVHCFAQGIIQSFLFSIDQDYFTLLDGITNAAAIPRGNLSFIEGSAGKLRLEMCNDIPYGQPDYPCSIIFESVLPGTEVVSNLPLSLDGQLRQTIVKKNFGDGITVTPIRSEKNSAEGVRLNGRDGTSVLLNQQCAGVLVYPRQILNKSKKEEVVFIVFQFWLFIISMIAVMNDSVPHTLTVIFARTLNTGWSSYALWRTGHYKSQFSELVMDPTSPCAINLFPEYFSTRTAYEIPDLILNVTALLTSGYLSWTLLRVYNAQSFKRVGAPEQILHLIKYFNAMLVCIQLEAFVLMTAMGLWLDVLLTTAIAAMSEHTIAYKTCSCLTVVFLLPWVASGWYSIRREMKYLILVFWGIAFVLLFGWSFMFYSIVYRWTFTDWPLLSCFTVASFILIISTVILAIICRVNFGKGLKEYLQAEATLASSNFSAEVFTHDAEKGRISVDSKSIYEDDTFPTPLYMGAPTLRFNAGREIRGSLASFNAREGSVITNMSDNPITIAANNGPRNLSTSSYLRPFEPVRHQNPF